MRPLARPATMLPSNYLVSAGLTCRTLNVTLTRIPDRDCCGAAE